MNSAARSLPDERARCTEQRILKNQGYGDAGISTPPLLCEIAAESRAYQRSRQRRPQLADTLRTRQATWCSTDVASQFEVRVLGRCFSNSSARTRAFQSSKSPK